MNRSWSDASAYCFQRNGGLAHSTHSKLIVMSPILSSNELVWIGLGWVEQRLQWMTHIPHEEETNITNILVDFEETLLEDKTPLTVTWLGKIACEIFCFSTGKPYRSKEIVLSLPQFLTLQIDFTFSRQFVSLPETKLYFTNEMLNGLKNQTKSQAIPIYYTELPQIIPHARNKAIDTFRFCAHLGPLNFLSCMTPFHDHKKHCVRIIHPQQFSKSITQCTAGYQNDQLDASWDLSTWIKFSLDWLDENKNLEEYSALKFNELWLPAQRRTTLGSLWPVWPWNITTLSLQENSWGDEMKSIVIRLGLHADWSRLNASLSCLALDTETKSVKSVSCQKVLPMICVRPKMKWNPSIFHESNRNFALRAQCPFGWLTSTLISERNFCYKIFNNSEIKFTFDEAEAECNKQDARLAIASQPSALAVLLNIFAFEELTQTSDFWIGLKKSDKGFKWTDQSYWVYEKEIEHDFDGKASLDNNAYGVSFIVLPEIANEIPQSPTIKWKVWPKEPRLNSFICQKEIFPQREAVLQIRLDDTFRPEVVRKLLEPFHKNQSEMNKTLSDLVSSKLVCFFDNYVNYVSTEKLTPRNPAIINYKIIEGEIPGILGWRAAEISCETWDDWSPEPMRASWMMSDNPNGAVSFSSLIVWLRHRTVKYSSEIHDATFKVSNSHREAFKHTLNETFVREFVKLHPRYSYRVMAAPEPVAFESEFFLTSNCLSIKFWETIRQNISGWNPIVAELDLLGETLKKCVNYMNEDGREDSISDFVTIVQEIHDLNTDTLIGAQQTKTDSIENSTSHRFPVESQFIAAGSWDRVDNDTDIIGFSVATKKNSIVRTSVLSLYPTSEEMEQYNTVVLLPFQHISEKEKVTFIAYPDARNNDASAASEKFASKVFMADKWQPDRWSQSKDLYTGNGGMVQVHLNPTPPRLQKPIKILFRPKFPTTEDKSQLLRCVFWNEQMNSGYGGWSTDGCWYNGTDQNGMEVCLCHHLSTFTLLVSRSEKELQDTDHGKVLTIITLIGSSASILGLSLILATFIFFPPWRKSLGHKILFQFSSALIFLLLTFTLGVGYTENVIVCQIVAIFLHYFLLSGFCWMTVEAYHQYHRFVKVFGTYMPRFLLKASIFWHGVYRSFPVASVLFYDVDSYSGSEGYCWSIIAAGRGLRTNQSESKQTKDKLWASFLNFILLGLTWIFGFLAIGATNAVIFSYLFCVTSSLQGFIIFVLYVGRDPSTRKMWLELFGVGKSEIRTVEPKTKSSTVSKTTGNSESSCSTTVATGNGLSCNEVQYVEVVPFKIEVRQAQLEATTNFD
uniref:Uncharacterized protein n=1 Tax=Daphnia galeata TaxID=27404 RepID=A0A8J2RGU3_9CRUS|nr:unnamed protein product [Daphnia galeata]